MKRRKNSEPWPYGFIKVGVMRDVNVKTKVNVSVQMKVNLQTENQPTAVALRLQRGGRNAECESEGACA